MMRKTKTLNAAEQNKIREEATVTLRRGSPAAPFAPCSFSVPGRQPNGRFSKTSHLRPNRSGSSSRASTRETNIAGELARERKRIWNTIGNECLPSPMPPDAKTCADIPDLFEEAGQNALAAGKGLLLAVNDMERLSRKESAVLIAALHRTTQSNSMKTPLRKSERGA